MANSFSSNVDRLCPRCKTRQGISKKSKVNEKDCLLCGGIFLNIEELGKKSVDILKSIKGDVKTFAVGHRIPKYMDSFEEKVWEQVDITKAESIKGELNRELGKYIEKHSKFKFKSHPDVRLLINPITKEIEKKISNVYYYGRYKKLKRFVRQTKRRDSDDESVEGFMENPILKLIGGTKAVLHGAGREDIDATMIGSGRPFVVEIMNPKFRRLSAKKIENAINKSANGAIKIVGLKESDKGQIEIIKRAKFDKTYDAEVEVDKPVSAEDLKNIPESVMLNQRTPLRVLSRRADLIRKRRVKSIKTEIGKKKSKKFRMRLVTQAGTYVKEFISGDEGRTIPSVSAMLKRKAKCIELNVIEVHGKWYEDFW